MAKAILVGDILDDNSFIINSGAYPASGISGGIMGNIWGNLYICNVAFYNSSSSTFSTGSTLFTLDGIKATSAVTAYVTSNASQGGFAIGIRANSQAVILEHAPLPSGKWLFGHIIIPVTRA